LSKYPPERPKWVKAISTFISDTILDYEYELPADGSDDDLLEQVEKAVQNIFCAHYGHQIEDDQCGKPEHRFCIWCNILETSANAAGDPTTDTH
jgi:hypothetical protein